MISLTERLVRLSDKLTMVVISPTKSDRKASRKDRQSSEIGRLHELDRVFKLTGLRLVSPTDKVV